MPALSSTMTEGKVRSVGADWSCWEEGGGPPSERASERGEIDGASFLRRRRRPRLARSFRASSERRRARKRGRSDSPPSFSP